MTIIKEYRIDHDLGQEEMAKKLGCSVPAYRLYERGQKVLPHRVLAKFLQLRALPEDLELLEALEAFYETKKCI